MIAYIDIKVNAAHPNIPLAPFYAFQASPSNVRIVNVPPRIGKWQITAVSVTLTLPDNSATTVPAVNVAGCWVATLPGSDVTGYCAAGLQVNASGVDENGAAVTGYCLGIGDVTVLGRDAAIAADGIKYYLHYLADVPEVPRKGDVCVIDGTLKWYDGAAWQAFGASVVIDPTLSIEGAAADAKAAGTAIAAKCTQAEAVTASVAEMTAVVEGWQWPETFTYNGNVYHYVQSYEEMTDTSLHYYRPGGEPSFIEEMPGWMVDIYGYEYDDGNWEPTITTAFYDTTSGADATTLNLSNTDLGISLTLTYATQNKHGFARLVDLPAASTATPQMDGTASAGSSEAFARGDHVHPKDTSKQDVISDLAAIRSGAAAGATAVQPSALAGAVRYDFGMATVISAASTDTSVTPNIDYGTATLADRTANRVAITAAIAELRITFPAAISGKVRDFGLRVEVGTGSAALTAPALVPVAPTGETITLENADGEIPALADGAADAKGVTLLYFSETSPGKFLVKGEEVKEA